MRCFLDTNVFVAAVLDTDEAEATGTATTLLNANHEFLTSLLNLMELRTVLTKKHRLERDRAAAIEDEGQLPHPTSLTLTGSLVEGGACP